MKIFFRRLTALCLSGALLLSGGAFAADLGDDEAGYAGQTIDIETKFDFIMQYVDWFSLGAEGQDVLRQYFNQYFEKHPEEFVQLVNDIMQSIDSHSMYMSAEEYAATFGQSLSAYVGIGITMSSDGGGLIEDVYEDGPAYEAGLRAGDVFVKVGDTNVEGKPNGEITPLVRGEEGTSVSITVRRGGELLTFSVERRAVSPQHVSSKTLAKGVEYVKVAAMGNEGDTQKFVKIWNGLAAKGTRAAILDLRGNGGGLVSMAQTMIETIVPDEGRKYLGLRYREDDGGRQEFFTPGGGPRLNKLIILVNGGSASASEIVAGSLSDLGEATLLGEPTYGKGVGQYHMPMPDGSMLILTSFEMQLPKRGVYEGEGLKPDLYIENSGAKTSMADALTPLPTDAVLRPGDRGDAVRAMTERLSLLGYLDGAQDGFDAAVLGATRRFAAACGILPGFAATGDLLAALDAQAQAVQRAADGLDDQLATALGICKLAAEKPAQYEALPDGTWRNLSDGDEAQAG